MTRKKVDYNILDTNKIYCNLCFKNNNYTPLNIENNKIIPQCNHLKPTFYFLKYINNKWEIIRGLDYNRNPIYYNHKCLNCKNIDKSKGLYHFWQCSKCKWKPNNTMLKAKNEKKICKNCNYEELSIGGKNMWICPKCNTKPDNYLAGGKRLINKVCYNCNHNELSYYPSNMWICPKCNTKPLNYRPDINIKKICKNCNYIEFSKSSITVWKCPKCNYKPDNYAPGALRINKCKNCNYKEETKIPISLWICSKCNWRSENNILYNKKNNICLNCNYNENTSIPINLWYCKKCFWTPKNSLLNINNENLLYLKEKMLNSNKLNLKNKKNLNLENIETLEEFLSVLNINLKDYIIDLEYLYKNFDILNKNSLNNIKYNKYEVINENNYKYYNKPGVYFKYNYENNIILDIMATSDISKEYLKINKWLKNKDSFKYNSIRNNYKNIDFILFNIYDSYKESMIYEFILAILNNSLYWSPSPGWQSKLFYKIIK